MKGREELMMSLMRANLVETVKKQYLYKLKANIDALSSLVTIQLLAIFFSFGGVGSSGMGSENISIHVKYYSADIVIIFTMIWAFVTAITITTRSNRNHDFTFITNRLSSSLSNILFIITTVMIGSMTAILAGNLLRTLSYLQGDYQFYSMNIGLPEFMFSMFVTFLYVFLVSSIGYFVGTLVQVSKIFVILIPVLFFGMLFLESSLQRESFLANVFQFYFMESVLSLFIFKVIATFTAFFTASISILNRMEVRR